MGELILDWITLVRLCGSIKETIMRIDVCYNRWLCCLPRYFVGNFGFVLSRCWSVFEYKRNALVSRIISTLEILQVRESFIGITYQELLELRVDVQSISIVLLLVITLTTTYKDIHQSSRTTS